MSKRRTPRTDANSWTSPESDSGRVCDARFAARLERELAATEDKLRKLVEVCIELLCDPDGYVSFHGSAEDLAVMQDAIDAAREGR